jgi:hypothetical protein
LAERVTNGGEGHFDALVALQRRANLSRARRAAECLQYFLDKARVGAALRPRSGCAAAASALP